MTKRWLFHPTPSAHQVDALASALGISSTIATLLVQRGITTFDEAKAYFRPSLADLPDPFAMKDMHQAVQRLQQALARQERILVYGDYDVDGVTSVAMFYGFLQSLKAQAFFYIPDRYAEGYGISKKGIEWAAQQGIQLMVSLDCGIMALNAIRYAQEKGIDVIVCDHHEPGPTLPPACALLDPKQPDCPYPTKGLSGCGVGFKLMQGLTQQQGLSEENLYSYLDLVAVSIACDVVPIVDENRVLMYHGLQRLNMAPRPGLKALMALGELRHPLNVSNLVFGFGPRINAAGRIEHAASAVHLLLATADTDAEELAKAINTQNSLRKEIDSTITAEALDMIESTPPLLHAKTTVLFKEDWHKGVVGIVASRCLERYYRPTVILTTVRGKATGSARSVVGYNIYEALTACADLLDQYGGHACAAGLTLPVDNVPAFQQRFEEVVAQTIPTALLTPAQEIDLPLRFDEINDKFYNVLRQMAPFGPGNMRTVFVTDPVVAQRYEVIKDRHLKLYVSQPGTTVAWEAIGFDLAHCEPLVREQQPFRLVYYIMESYYWGERQLQLNIKDVKGISDG